jgi:hypothetical protein
MPVDLDNSSTVSGDASVSSTGNQNLTPKSVGKKKRNLPGMPGTSQKSKLFFFCFLSLKFSVFSCSH